MDGCKQETQTHKYVVLSIKKGFGFSLWREKLVRIVVEFEKKTLSAPPFYILSEDSFNCNFTWRIENTLLNRLRNAQAEITIELKLLEVEQAECKLGFARIGLNVAEFVSVHDAPIYRLKLQDLQLPFEFRAPQIYVSLTIQSIIQINATERCYSSELEEGASDSTKDIPDSVNQAESSGYAPTTSGISPSSSSSSKKQTNLKKVGFKKVQFKPTEQNEGIKTSEISESKTFYFTSLSDLRSLPECSSKSTETSSNNEITNKREKKKTRTVQPVERIALEDFIEVSKKASVVTVPSMNEDDDTEIFHLYKLELQIEKIEWNKTFGETQVFIRLYNPSINNTVSIENKDYFVPNLSLSDVVCHMFYISQPSQLLETISLHPPHILIQRAANKKLIAKAIVTVTDFKQESQTEYFRSDAQVLTYDNEVLLGTMNLLLKFTDLGIPPSDKNSKFLVSVIEYKGNVSKPEMLHNEMIAEVSSCFQRLLGIHEKIVNTYCKIDEDEKLLKKSDKVKSGIEIVRNFFNRFQKEKSKMKDSEIPTEIKSKIIEKTEEPSSGTSSVRSEKILFCNICQAYHKAKHDCDNITAIETIDSDDFKKKHVSPEDLSKLDVNIKSGNKRSDRKPLPDQIKTDTKHKPSHSPKQIARQTVKPITGSKPKQTLYTSKPSATTGKQQCQKCGKYLETGFSRQIWQDNKLVFWCKDCNIKHLQAELKEAVHICTEKMIGLTDYVKSLESERAQYTANTVSREEYERLTAAHRNLTMSYVQERDKHLRKYAESARRLEDTDQVKEDEAPIDSSSTIDEILQEISERNLTLSRGRYRCEACRIIQKRLKDAPPKTNKSEQSSPTFSLKSTESKLSPSTSQPTPDWIKYDTDESKKTTSLLTGMCEQHIRERIDIVRERLRHYLEERYELVVTHSYSFDNPVVSYMDKTINELVKELNELKNELNKYNQ